MSNNNKIEKEDKATALDVFVKTNYNNDETWEAVEAEIATIYAIKSTEEKEAAQKSFKEKYDFDYKSLRPYSKMRRLMLQHLEADNDENLEKANSEIAALKAENEELQQELRKKRRYKIKDAKVDGEMHKVQVYTTPDAYAAFSALIDFVAVDKGIKKFRATALVMKEAARVFMPKN